LRGYMELRESKRHESKKVRVNSLIYKTSNDGLSEFYD